MTVPTPFPDLSLLCLGTVFSVFVLESAVAPCVVEARCATSTKTGKGQDCRQRAPAKLRFGNGMAPAGVCEDALQGLVPDRCRPAREPLGNSWPRRSWGAIRSVKHRVTPGCRADGCTNPVLPLRCRNQKVRNHKTIILLLKMRAVNAKLHDLCSHPRGTRASPDVLSNGSLPMAAALTY